MAPLHRRQMHFIPPPRPPKGPPGTPVPVTKLISIKVFLLLFLGTACIFIVGVFFWRIGAVIRFFTQDKVLGGGRKPTTARYAKTWYGWVPLARHEANKQIFKKCFRKIRRWMEWKSSRADYSWVWWDPGQNGREKYYSIRRVFLRWLPKWLMSYDSPPADSIWNPGLPTADTETANDDRENRDPRDKDIQADSERRTPITGGRTTPYPGINIDGSPAILEPPAIIQPSLVDKHQDSWRIAVNRERKSAGLQDLLNAIELFDGSADEPPDGKIDPASWILRRPPQGFGMSTKQKDAYYEGGAGWQETLSDWQKVRRGYRIRKGIYEGRVNRTRVKEIASESSSPRNGEATKTGTVREWHDAENGRKSPSFSHGRKRN
ncbi:hypothetical protein VTN02DRAFT_1562 [Thermoascus thermophilus]